MMVKGLGQILDISFYKSENTVNRHKHCWSGKPRQSCLLADRGGARDSDDQGDAKGSKDKGGTVGKEEPGGARGMEG